MRRRRFLRSAGLGAAALAAPGCAGAPEGAAEDGPSTEGARTPRDAPKATPNIVFVMVDDMGYHDLGCYGSKTILTPNIDCMAAEGMRFTDAYSGATVCAPARSILMTGYHMGHTSVRGNSGGVSLLDEDVTVAEVLKQAGYATGGFGKWGLGEVGTAGVAEKQGFDTFFGYYHQVHAHHHYTPYLWRNSVRVPLPGNDGRKGTQYTQNEIQRETLAFIRENRDRPFFCYAPWTPPHAGYQFPQDDPVWDMYKEKPWPNDARVAAAMDTMIDRHVGEIMKLLKDLELDEKTIMFFCSDNGAAKRFEGVHDSCGPMKGFKRSMYEGGIRTPMVVRWPGRIAPGAVSDLQWYFPDVMPTLAELAGATAHVPEDIDGISVVPTLLGERAAGRAQEKHEYLYWEHGNVRAVRSGDWKLLARMKGSRGGPATVAKRELYDLSKDIGEKNNVAAAHPDVADRLAAVVVSAHTPPRPQREPPKVGGKRYR